MSRILALLSVTVVAVALPSRAGDTLPPYAGPWPVQKLSAEPIAGEPATVAHSFLRVPAATYTVGFNSGSSRTVPWASYYPAPARFSYAPPVSPTPSVVLFTDDFASQFQNTADWVRYFGPSRFFTRPDYVTADSVWPQPAGIDWSADFAEREQAWEGLPTSPVRRALEQRTFNRTSEGILRLDPWHTEQNQPWDLFFGNAVYQDLNEPTTVNGQATGSLIVRSPAEYNWWDLSSHMASGASDWEFLYVLQRELPANFEFSFTLVRHGAWGGFGLILGRDPRHLPNATGFGVNSNTSQGADFFPVAREDQPCAIAYFQNPQASHTYPANYNTIARWKDRGYLRPLFVADGTNTEGTNKGWNPNIVLQSRTLGNGTHDERDGGSALGGFGQAWPYLYALKAGVPYRVTMARVNGIIYLTVRNIASDADPSDWIAYRSDVRDPNGLGRSSGPSATLPASASTLPPADDQRLYFWCQSSASNGYFANGVMQHPLEAGEETWPAANETTFGGAIDDVVLRAIASETDLTPLPTVLTPTLTASVVAARSVAVTAQSNISPTPTSVTYVTYRVANPTTQTARNIQIYGEGNRWEPVGSNTFARVPIKAFDQNGDLPLEGQPTIAKDTLSNVVYDTRPWSLGKGSGDLGNQNAVVLAYVAKLEPGESRDVTVAYVLPAGSFDLPENFRAYLTAGPQNTRIHVLSNAMPAIPESPTVTNLSPFLVPGSTPPAKPPVGKDGVTGPYGFYDWEYAQGSWIKVPLAFPSEPAAEAGGHWEPYLDANKHGQWRWVADPVSPSPDPSPTPASDHRTTFGKFAKIQQKRKAYLMTVKAADRDGIKAVRFRVGRRIYPTKKRAGAYVAKMSTQPHRVMVWVLDKGGHVAVTRLPVKVTPRH